MESDLVDSLAGAHRNATVYRYNIGDPVLITNHTARMTNCVNRFGFPPGGGATSEEQRGPYIYILGTVKTVHYEENAVFYTVSRVDTGWDVRGDPGTLDWSSKRSFWLLCFAQMASPPMSIFCRFYGTYTE